MSCWRGLGGAVAEARASEWPVPVERVGVRNLFTELLEHHGLSAFGIAAAARKPFLRRD